MDFRELERLRKDATRVRGLAQHIWQVIGDDLDLDANAFVHSMMDFAGDDGISHRQAEWLLDLRAKTTLLRVHDGFDVVAVVRDVWMARSELDEHDEAFIQRMYGRGEAATFSTVQWQRVRGLWRTLNPDLVSDDTLAA